MTQTKPPADWPLAEYNEHCHAAGMDWRVTRIGTGPPLLLLHGTGASSHSWIPVALHLMDDFECIIPDLPGHGFSDPLPKRTVTLPAVSRALIVLMDTLGVTPVLIAGHSAGSAIAVQNDARLCTATQTYF
jgi:magnesium chelatase accessory protein